MVAVCKEEAWKERNVADLLLSFLLNEYIIPGGIWIEDPIEMICLGFCKDL